MTILKTKKTSPCTLLFIQAIKLRFGEMGFLSVLDKQINGWHPCCSIDPRSLQEYGGEVHEGICEAMSMPGQVTGKCSGCHMHLELQTSSQTCQGTLSKAVQEGTEH